jgi:hypothetical protein
VASEPPIGLRDACDARRGAWSALCGGATQGSTALSERQPPSAVDGWPHFGRLLYRKAQMTGRNDNRQKCGQLQRPKCRTSRSRPTYLGQVFIPGRLRSGFAEAERETLRLSRDAELKPGGCSPIGGNCAASASLSSGAGSASSKAPTTGAAYNRVSRAVVHQKNGAEHACVARPLPPQQVRVLNDIQQRHSSGYAHAPRRIQARPSPPCRQRQSPSAVPSEFGSPSKRIRRI